jgi:hypothetical protein
MRVDLGLPGHAEALAERLRSFDPAASVSFDAAYHQEHGIVVVGAIGLSRSPRWSVEFAKTDDGYTARDMWVPGGHVKRFTWSWKWQDAGKPGGEDVEDDRWTLSRPPGVLNRWGPTGPLPGLDGPGTVKLDIDFVAVDDETGDVTTSSASSEPIVLTLPPGLIPTRSCR